MNSTCPRVGNGIFIWVPPYQIVSSIVCAYTPRPHLGKESHDWERGIPHTVGMLYTRASQSAREALCGNGIPVWFCLAWNLLGLDSSLLTSISSGALFQARDIVHRKRIKPSSPKQENGLESGLTASALFENKKSRDSRGFCASKNPG